MSAAIYLSAMRGFRAKPVRFRLFTGAIIAVLSFFALPAKAGGSIFFSGALSTADTTQTTDNAPAIDLSSMPDSLKSLILDALNLIDDLSIKENEKTEVRADSNAVTVDTVIKTTFVKDTIFTNEVRSIFSNVIDTSVTPAPVVLAAAADTTRAEKDSASVLPPIEIPKIEMCPEAQALLKKRNDILTSENRPVNPIFLPIVFDGQRPSERPAITSKKETRSRYELNRRKSDMERDREMKAIGEYAQAEFIVNSPDKVHYTPEMLPDAIHMERVKRRKEFLEVKGYEMPRLRELKSGPIKLKHWISELNSALQISQVYISENWYQGGASNINLISTQHYSLDYKDYENEKILFENDIDWKLNICSTPDDSLRSYAISEDLFRIDSKFGYKAFWNFYYSVSLSFKTQFFNLYKKNTQTRTASFLSPGELNLNLGITHNYKSKDNSLETSVSLSPVAYNLKTCIDKKIDPTKFGLDEGKTVLNKIGSSAEASIKWEFMRHMYLNSRFYYFTSYERVQIDFENTLNFVLNRYFSTRIEFKMRYDDSVAPNAKGSYLQFKELLSFGLYFRI